jgi:protein TonB
MSTLMEQKGRASMQATAIPMLPLTSVRQFTIDQIAVRLASEPGLVGRLWDQIAKSESPRPPDLTVFYCSVGWRGEIYSVIEFVAGETLEEFVKRSDPAVCEQEIPLFCKLLDAFEAAGAKPVSKSAPASNVELLDFGVVRATTSVKVESHGAVLAGHDGTWSEAVFGKSNANQVRPILMELSSNLSGGFQHPAVVDAATIGDCVITSLASPVPLSEPAAAIPSATNALLARWPVSPYLIGVGTTLVMLGMLYFVGGFLAKRSVPPNAGKLDLPLISEPVATAAPTIPLTLDPPAATPPAKKQPKPAKGTIVLTRGARPIVQTKLQYPADARKERISGVVEMQLTIAEDGSVHSPRVLSGDPLLGVGLAEQVSKWVYQPLRVNGKPVPMTTELAIRFDLNQ